MTLSVFWPIGVLLLRILCSDQHPIFLIGLIRVLVSSFLSSLYILEIRPLSDEGLVKISQSVGCLLVLLTVSFALQKLLSFRRSHLFIDSLIVCATRGSTQEVVSCAHVLQTTSHLLFYQVQCGQIKIEVFNPFELEFCAWRHINLFSFFYMLISSYSSTTC